MARSKVLMIDEHPSESWASEVEEIMEGCIGVVLAVAIAAAVSFGLW